MSTDLAEWGGKSFKETTHRGKGALGAPKRKGGNEKKVSAGDVTAAKGKSARWRKGNKTTFFLASIR